MQSHGVQHHILQCPADSRPCATTSDHATCGEENQVTQQELNWNCICFYFILFIYIFKHFLNVFLHLPPQVEDADSQCSISGVTVDSTETEGVIMDAVDTEDLLLLTDTPLHHLEDSHPPSAPCSPQLSPADQALARLHCSASSECNSLRGSPPPDSCDLRCERISLFLIRVRFCVQMVFSSPVPVQLPWRWTARTKSLKQSLPFPRFRVIGGVRTEWTRAILPLTSLSLPANRPCQHVKAAQK